MNADTLLQHFERIAEAPDAIPRLRQFILDLAVRGKLVPQESCEKAADLHEQLTSSLEEMLRIDGARRRKEIEDSAMFFAEDIFPSTWVVTSFDAVDAIVSGVAKGKDLRGFKTETYSYLRVANVQRGHLDLSHIKEIEIKAGEINRYRLEAGDVLMTEGGDWDKLGRAALWNNEIKDCIHQNHIYRIRSVNKNALLPQWIALFANSPLGRSYFENASKQTTNLASINMTQLRSCPLPLPPTGEQHRIVAKVDELMALCDRLEAAKAERETRRDRLAAATLHGLNNAADIPAFRNHAHFALNHLAHLTTRPDQISQLRQTILNLAFRGKLVPQDPNDEPAAALLKEIQAAKERLVKEGSIPCQKRLVSIKMQNSQFDIPTKWQSVRFGDVCNVVTSGSRGWGDYYSTVGVKFVRAQNIRFGRLHLDDLAFVDLPPKMESARAQVSMDDLLIVITGAGVTNPALVDHDMGEAFVSQHVALIKLTEKRLSRWMLLCLMAPDGGRTELLERAYGAGKPGLNLDNIRSLNIVLPPLDEQHRIVAKVDELMALCDRLEAQLTTSQSESRRLLEATLHAALADNV